MTGTETGTETGTGTKTETSSGSGGGRRRECGRAGVKGTGSTIRGGRRARGRD